MDFVKNKTAPADKITRAIMLSWLLHLIGDLHQARHPIALVNDTYPHGDRGGNAVFVMREDSTVTDLHTFWDHILGSSVTVMGAVTLARQILAAFPANSGAISGDYKDWAKADAHLGIVNLTSCRGKILRLMRRKVLLHMGSRRALLGCCTGANRLLPIGGS